MALFPPGGEHAYPPGKFYATDAITDYALDFIGQGRKDRTRPWFVYLAYQAAHFPLMAPEDEVKKYVPVYEQGWDRVRDDRLRRLKSLGVLRDSAALSPRSLIPRPTSRAGTAWKPTPTPRGTPSITTARPIWPSAWRSTPR